jgi:O-antigen biosynthesis protein
MTMTRAGAGPVSLRPEAFRPEAFRPKASRPKAPRASAWGELARGGRLPPGRPVVDVIVPVYRGYDDTLACIHSVLASGNATAYELVAINDCSPEPGLVAALEAIAAQGLIHLVHNDANQGFVRSVTMGMARHGERDVILLNSDTIVHGNWIDRLRAHRLASKAVGTITPWSNNATILSYPFTCANNDFDLEIDFAELDRLAAGKLAGAASDIPTGVGFCFYVSRDCMNDIGTFNSRAFGRGYGEENDFCLRAAARGWRNIAACDVFVRHTGEVSFRDDAVEERRLASAALLKLHPSYNELIAAFMRADPLRPHRQTLDLARLERWGGGQLLLIFGSDPSGGPHPPDENKASLVAEDGVRVVRVCPLPDDAQTLVMHPVADLALPNLPRLATRDVAAAVRTLADMGVARAEIDSGHGYTPEQSRFMRELCGALRR